MQRFMLKSKIHRATLTATNLDYEGSIAIDPVLLRAADILPGEQVHVLNLNNGSRLVTYAIVGDENTGMMMLNGPAARAGMPGDLVVIISYCACDDDQCSALLPKIVHVDSQNQLQP